MSSPDNDDKEQPDDMEAALDGDLYVYTEDDLNHIVAHVYNYAKELDGVEIDEAEAVAVYARDELLGNSWASNDG